MLNGKTPKIQQKNENLSEVVGLKSNMYFLQQDQCDAKISNNTKRINRIMECTECECSILGDTYTFILGKCYYVEINLLNYSDSMVNCQNQFGSNHIGKLFEPRDLVTNNLVTTYAHGLKVFEFWLGINDIEIEGTFQYATGGNLVFTNWHSGQPDNQYGIQNCVMTGSVYTSITEWDDQECDLLLHSICEII